MTKFLNISTDTSLGGNSPSDDVVASQKAISTALSTKQDALVSGTNIKTVNGTSLLGSGNITISSSVDWGFIGGTLADQTDLKNALDAKANDSGVVHIADAETITGNKTFTGTTTLGSNTTLAAQNTTVEGGEIGFASAPQEPNAGKTIFIDRYDGSIRIVGADSNDNVKVMLKADVQNGELYGVTPSTNDNSTKIATTEYVRSVLCAGIIAPFAGPSIPTGWLVCDGSAISRTDYAGLFAAIGSTYGDGDGSTTFNLPDLNDKLPLYNSGATLGTTTNGKAPNISGRVGPPKGDVQDNSSGAFYLGGTYASGPLAKHSNQQIYTMDASRCSAVYDSNATGITPAGVYTLWCIKY